MAATCRRIPGTASSGPRGVRCGCPWRAC